MAFNLLVVLDTALSTRHSFTVQNGQLLLTQVTVENLSSVLCLLPAKIIPKNNEAVWYQKIDEHKEGGV